jgi:hypothetical protein
MTKLVADTIANPRARFDRKLTAATNIFTTTPIKPATNNTAPVIRIAGIANTNPTANNGLPATMDTVIAQSTRPHRPCIDNAAITGDTKAA